jgi:hypothetical protein
MKTIYIQIVGSYQNKKIEIKDSITYDIFRRNIVNEYNLYEYNLRMIHNMRTVDKDNFNLLLDGSMIKIIKSKKIEKTYNIKEIHKFSKKFVEYLLINYDMEKILYEDNINELMNDKSVYEQMKQILENN